MQTGNRYLICPLTSGRFLVRFMLESKGTSKYCQTRENTPSHTDPQSRWPSSPLAPARAASNEQRRFQGNAASASTFSALSRVPVHTSCPARTSTAAVGTVSITHVDRTKVEGEGGLGGLEGEAVLLGVLGHKYVKNYLSSRFMISSGGVCFKVPPRDWKCVTKTQTHGALKRRNCLICARACMSAHEPTRRRAFRPFD